MAGGLCARTALTPHLTLHQVKLSSPLNAAALISGSARLGLKIHRETKEHTGDVLVVAKGGSKLKEAVEDVEHPAVAVDNKAQTSDW
jgi:hypothetical protein